MNILINFEAYANDNATAKTMYDLVTNNLPVKEDNYYETTYYQTLSNFVNDNKQLNQKLKKDLFSMLISNGLMIGGANTFLYPACYTQGVTQAQAILNTNGSIAFAYLVEFDGTNTTYKSIRINSLNIVVSITNGTAVITSNDEMFTFVSEQIEGSIAMLPI